MKVGIIGFGVMGEALAAGLKASHPDIELLVYEKIEASRLGARERYGARICPTPADVASSSDLLVVAVKPQNTDEIIASFKPVTKGARIISIVAGKPIAYFQAGLATTQVIRFMPNIAARVGKALVGVSAPSEATDEFRGQAVQIARAIGEAVELPEELLAGVTGLSGSGIAYVLAFLHAMALGGTQAGIAYPTSLKIALETALGAVALVKESGDHPIALLSKVISPAGTTVQGVRALEEAGFTASVMDAVVRAADRAREIEG